MSERPVKVPGFTHRVNKPRLYKFSEFQVQAAKLRAKGYTLKQTARRLKERFGLPREPETNQVSQAVSAFKETAKYMRQAVAELGEAGYWRMLVDRRPASVRALEKEEQMLQEGFWIFNRVPYGYMKQDGRLRINPEEAKVVNQIFEFCAQGKSPLQYGLKARGGSPTKIYRMISNPVYKGYIRFRGKLFQGKHEPIVSENVWEQAQIIRMGKKPPPPFGYRWFGSKLLPIPEEREIVQKIFNYRLEKKSTLEIGRLLKRNPSFVTKIIRRLLYKTKEWRTIGQMVEAEGEPFIPVVVWDEAQRIRVTSSDHAEKCRSQLEVDILNYLKQCHFATTKQIAEAAKKPRGRVKEALILLKWNGKIDRKRTSGNSLLWFSAEKPPLEKAKFYEVWGELITKGKPEYLKRIVDQLPARTSEISKKTGIHKQSTITSWLKRLEQKNVVERHPPVRLGRWHLTREWAKFLGKEESAYERLWSEITARRMCDDLKKVLQALLNKPETSGELSKMLGLSQHTIGEWLKVLKIKGVAEKHPPHVFGKWHIKSEFAQFLNTKLEQAQEAGGKPGL